MGFSEEIGIDLGTANVLVYTKGKGIVLQEPSVVAVDEETNEILAVGSEAKDMLGRTPANIIAIRPLRDGVVSDYLVTEMMLKYFIKKTVGAGKFFRPRIMVCVPSGVTEVEKRAVREAATQAGGKDVFLMEEPIAAAIGAGIDVDAPFGSMVVDIGGGTSEVAVISLGGIVSWKTVRVAGDSHDEAICEFIKKKYGISVGYHNAEDIKLKIGTIQKNGDDCKEAISGRNAINGMPCSSFVTGADIRCALVPKVSTIIDAIKNVLEETPPELSADILKSGIILTGGGALLDGLATVIQNAVNIPVRVAESPLECVALGAGAIIDGRFKSQVF
jgi:rod shape-determining protein MreB